MTPARLAALREAERRATPEGWRNTGDTCFLHRGTERIGETENLQDARLIAIARNELPALLDALERAHALLREARPLVGCGWTHREDERGKCPREQLQARIDAALEGQ